MHGIPVTHWITKKESNATIYYSISKEYDITTEAARKSIYRVSESARQSSDKEYLTSIFGNNNLNNISPSRFLEVITWKFRNEKR